MLDFIENQKNKWYDWARERAEGKTFKRWLAFIAFAESIILPIPTAVFLLALYGAGAKRWYYYAFLTTVFSILGGIIGYFVGFFFFDLIGIKIVNFYDLGHELEKVKGLYDENAFWVTFAGAFTPIPYKIFVLTAGFLKVNFLYFILASIIGRGLQFFLIAFVMKHFGDGATKIFLRYFNYFALVLIAVVVYLLLF